MSLEEGCILLDEEYSALQRGREIDRLDTKISTLDAEYADLKSVIKATRDEPNECRDCAEFHGYVMDEYKRLRDSRKRTRAHHRELQQEYQQIADDASRYIQERDPKGLQGCYQEARPFWHRPTLEMDVWDEVISILNEPDNPSENLNRLRSLSEQLGSHGTAAGGLPDAIDSLIVFQDNRKNEALALWQTAMAKAKQRHYSTTCDLLERAVAIDRGPHETRLRYFRGIVEAVDLRGQKRYVQAVDKLIRCQKNADGDGSAQAELERTEREGARYYERTGRDSSNELSLRIGSLSNLRQISAMCGTKTAASSVEKSIVRDLPEVSIRFDICRTSNDFGSKLYRLVQDRFESEGDEMNFDVRLMDVEKHISDYRGQDGIPIGDDEVFLVMVDVVDFDATVERDRNNDSVEYVSGHHYVTKSNPAYQAWVNDWNRSGCEDLQSSGNDFVDALAVTACVTLASQQPPQLVEEKVLDYSTCKYRTTNHSMFGIAEVRMEVYHVPEGLCFMDHTFHYAVNDVETEVEEVYGDCRAAGLDLRTLHQEPTSHDIELKLVEQIAAEVDQVISSDIKPTNVLTWLSGQFPEDERYTEAMYSAIYSEGGMAALEKAVLAR